MRGVSIKILGAVALAGALIAGPAFSAAYMKYSGVDGDVASATAARGHAGWVILESVSFSATPSCQPSGPGTAIMRAQSANNIRAMGVGVVPKVLIDIDNPTGGTALSYELENTLITGIQPAPTTAAAGARPQENVTISFGSIKLIGPACRR